MNGKWWHNAVGYIIYPQAFKDSNGDGIGDLNGIIEKLDYLSFLGVNLLWIGPIFDSANPYNGYDSRDFLTLAPRYGDMADLKRLLDEAHARGIRIIMDFPLNHTCKEHPWFQNALKDPTSEEAGYYYIERGKRKGRKLLPPCNWESFSEDSVWTRIGKSEYFYLHVFSNDIPDLNWSNPKLREKMYEALRYYLDMGVDGFRLDALAHLAKDTSWSDSSLPVKENGCAFDTSKYSNRPELYEYLRLLKQEVFSHYDCLIVGEVGGSVTPEGALKMASWHDGYINMVFNFDTVWNNHNYGSIDKKDDEIKTEVAELKKNFMRWYEVCGGKCDMPLYWCNHDHPRVLSQYGNPKYREESAKMLFTTILFLYGNDFIYFGDEIGMSNAEYDSLDDYLVDAGMRPEIERFRKQGYSDEWILHYLNRSSRINSRLPMQWDDSENAGFSDAKPLFRANPNYLRGVNVKDEMKDTDSIFHFYKYAIGIRKDPMINEQVLNCRLRLEDPENEDVFAYIHDGMEKIMVVSNMRDHDVDFTFYYRITDIMLHNYDGLMLSDGKLHLRPYESLLLRIS